MANGVTTAVADTISVTRQTAYKDLPEWLTVHEAATLLGTTKWFVYERVRSGDIPHRRIGSKLIQIPKRYFDPACARTAVMA